jgi:hypothetical protein
MVMEFRSSNGLRGRRMYTQADELLRTKTYGVGRVCNVEGCKTRLSAYNPSNICALHSNGWQDELKRATRKRREREEITRNCEFEPCSREFVTYNPAKKYCSDACRMRAFQARTVAARQPASDDDIDIAQAS